MHQELMDTQVIGPRGEVNSIINLVLNQLLRIYQIILIDKCISQPSLEKLLFTVDGG